VSNLINEEVIDKGEDNIGSISNNDLNNQMADVEDKEEEEFKKKQAALEIAIKQKEAKILKVSKEEKAKCPLVLLLYLLLIEKNFWSGIALLKEGQKDLSSSMSLGTKNTQSNFKNEEKLELRGKDRRRAINKMSKAMTYITKASRFVEMFTSNLCALEFYAYALMVQTHWLVYRNKHDIAIKSAQILH